MTTKSARQHARLLRAERTSLPLPPESWNVAPTSDCLVVRQDKAGAREDVLIWGLPNHESVPVYFNAKFETADVKPTFRRAWTDQHCVVPVDGWFEWQTLAGRKQPYYFRIPEHGPLFLAGLWDRRNFTLLTMAADGPLADYHHRRPVGLGVRAAQAWVDGAISQRGALLEQVQPGHSFTFHPVTPRMNRSGIDGADLIEPLEVLRGLEQAQLL